MRLSGKYQAFDGCFHLQLITEGWTDWVVARVTRITTLKFIHLFRRIHSFIIFLIEADCMVWCLVLYTCCNGTENIKTQRLRGEVSPCNQFFSPNVVNLANIGKLVICGKMLDKSYLGFGDRQQYSGNNVIANSRICFKKNLWFSLFNVHPIWPTAAPREWN